MGRNIGMVNGVDGGRLAHGRALSDTAGASAALAAERVRASVRELADELGADAARDLVEMYRAVAPSQLDALRAAADANDAVALGRAAHTLKSSSAALGAVDLAALCQVMEQRGEAGEGASLASLVAQAQESFAALGGAFDAATAQLAQ